MSKRERESEFKKGKENKSYNLTPIDNVAEEILVKVKFAGKIKESR